MCLNDCVYTCILIGVFYYPMKNITPYYETRNHNNNILIYNNIRRKNYYII